MQRAYAKPDRLPLACTPCRKRKVRCDASQPKCHNCTVRGDECQSLDIRSAIRTPALRTHVKRAGGRSSRRSAAAPATDAAVASPGGSIGGASSPALSRGVQPINVRRDDTGKGDDDESEPSWVSRGYRDTAAEKSTPSQSSGPSPDNIVVGTGVGRRSAPDSRFFGATSMRSLFGFIDLHLQSQDQKPDADAAEMFQSAVSRCENRPLSFIPRLLELPGLHVVLPLISRFFDQLWPLFPIVERPYVEEEVASLLRLQQAANPAVTDPSLLDPSRLSSLSMVYALVSIGLDDTDASAGHNSDQFLQASYGLNPFFVASASSSASVSSIQALLVLALALRARQRNEQAWQITGQAIRIAQSLGLHGKTTSGPDCLRGRIWWSCYALERMQHFETGRPSGLGPATSGMTSALEDLKARDPRLERFAAWVSLADLMGQISDSLYARNFTSSLQVFTEAARLDELLIAWERSLPGEFIPTAPSTDGAGADAPIVLTAFMTQQFRMAQIAVLRVSIIFPAQIHEEHVARHAGKIQNHNRLLHGSTICLDAARTIVTTSTQLADGNVKTSTSSFFPILLAVSVLALGMLRRPDSRTVRADFELLCTAIEILEESCCYTGRDAELARVCSRFRERIEAACNGAARPRSKRAVTDASTVGPDLSPLADGPISGIGQFSNEVWAGMELGDLWDLVNSDVQMHDTLYHDLGL